jgi:3',5'-cyclic AMP phosphodiesterase CpdA
MRKISDRKCCVFNWAFICALLACCSVLHSGEKPAGGEEAACEPWRSISIPDFLNNDVAYPDPRWSDALDFVLSEIRNENPDFVVVPGDLVMGRWSHSKEHLKEMASVYYPAWIERMNAYGLKFYAAVGGHELGDNPWNATKTELVPLYEEAFRTYLKMPTNGPSGLNGLAYYVKHKNLLMVVVDTFEKSDDGVVVGVSGDQLAWVEEILQGRHGSDHTIVVGHVPILRTWTGRTSSRLHIPDGGGFTDMESA